MAVFSRSDKSSVQSNNSITVIAEGSHIKGEFDMQCKFHVDGEVVGTIASSNLITIGTKGVIKGEIEAEKLMVSGLFEGNANCDSIEILSGGKFKGRVISKEFIIEPNGNFEGESKIKSDEALLESPVETNTLAVDEDLDVKEEKSEPKKVETKEAKIQHEGIDAIDAMIEQG